jgi:hypothetical protein
MVGFEQIQTTFVDEVNYYCFLVTIGSIVISIGDIQFPSKSF